MGIILKKSGGTARSLCLPIALGGRSLDETSMNFDVGMKEFHPTGITSGGYSSLLTWFIVKAPITDQISKSGHDLG